MLVNIEIEDETLVHHKKQVDDVISQGGVMVTLKVDNNDTFKDNKIHDRLVPLAIMLRFYLDIEQVAQQMGLNPDEPVGLNKVTNPL
jgi:glucosamine--fructose-6-phosphate aminotransferase (isomerizing)